MILLGLVIGALAQWIVGALLLLFAPRQLAGRKA